MDLRVSFVAPCITRLKYCGDLGTALTTGAFGEGVTGDPVGGVFIVACPLLDPAPDVATPVNSMTQ
jgi:hypothetical protein